MANHQARNSTTGGGEKITVYSLRSPKKHARFPQHNVDIDHSYNAENVSMIADTGAYARRDQGWWMEKHYTIR